MACTRNSQQERRAWELPPSIDPAEERKKSIKMSIKEAMTTVSTVVTLEITATVVTLSKTRVKFACISPDQDAST